MRRALILFTLLALTTCGDDDEPPPAPESFAPLHYEYLKQLRLNVANIDVQDRTPPPGAGDVTADDPVQPAQVLAKMARDRLFPAGVNGTAAFVIDDASITRGDDNVTTGVMDVHLEIRNAAGARVAYAEARVTLRHTPGSDPENPRSVMYDLTRDMMDRMNVELEFQLKRSLHDWLVSNTVVPAPVTVTPLAPAPAPPAPDEQPPRPELSPPPGFLQPPPGAQPQ